MKVEKRILRVDLNTRQSKVEAIPQEWIVKFLGGKGLGFRYLLGELSKRVDPLGPENRLLFMNGIFAGTIVPMAHKITVITKSPATGTITDGSMGGMFASELRFAGFDGLIIQGKASQPVCLVIRDGEIEIQGAEGLWGKARLRLSRECMKNWERIFASAPLARPEKIRFPLPASVLNFTASQDGEG